MLSKYYKNFSEQLFLLQKQVVLENIDIIKIKIIFEQVKIIFHSKILDENMHIYLENNDKHAIIQSIQVEINKNLRLLETELLFLESSRQSETIDKRASKIKQRVMKLRDYCKFINKQLCE